MTETSLNTDGFLQTTTMDPLPEASPIDTEDFCKEEETAPSLSRNPGEDEEPENEILYVQVNQERKNKSENTADRQCTKSQPACSSRNIEQKQPRRQKTSLRRTQLVRQKSGKFRCKETGTPPS